MSNIKKGEEWSRIISYSAMETNASCPTCGKTFINKRSLTRHVKQSHGNTEDKLKCPQCEYTNARADKLKRHVQSVHRTILNYTCDICGSQYDRKDNMLRHRRNHQAKAEEAAATPSTSTAAEPSVSATPMAKKRPAHEQEQAKVKQRRFEQQRLQTEAIIPTFVQPQHQELYRQNWRQIQTSSNTQGKRQRLYNVMLETATFEELENAFRDVHHQQSHQYKVNYSFGFVLYNNITGQRRYYHASNNTRVLDHPMLIQNAQGLNALLSLLGDVDILEYARKQRPNSQWVVEAITNVLIYVYPMFPTPIGTGKEPLPSFIRNNPSIFSLEKNNHSGHSFSDNLCFFRCMALHHGHSIKALEHPTLQLFSEYCTDDPTLTVGTFPGVTLHELRGLEDHFKVNIQVYSMDEQSQATLIRRSVTQFPTTLYLNLHGNHFSYIKDFKLYSKAHKCRSCNSVFETAWSCSRHEKSCQGKTKFLFPGGVFKPPASVFQKMAQHAIPVPRIEYQFYPFRATYDIECFMDKPDSDMTDTVKLTWIATHRVASISVCSNVPGYTESKCFVSTGSEAQLIDDFVVHLDEISETAHGLVEERYKELTESLTEAMNEEETFLGNGDDDDDDCDADVDNEIGVDGEQGQNGGKSKRERPRPIATIWGEFERWKKQLPVIGFNSAKYDINAMKSGLFPSLLAFCDQNEDGLPKMNVIKKQNSYMAISTDKLKILDILNFLAPNTSLVKFLKSFKIPESKGVFPYEWFTSLDQLTETHLPPHEAFYSKLKNGNISPEEYAQMQKVWDDEGMTCMRDFLVWYNNQDVKPFMQAIGKMNQYFKSRGLDLFKDGISLPGLAMKDLFHETGTFFSLFKKNDSDLYHSLRDQIVGGPSIIFNRYQEKGKTFIRNHQIKNPKQCESVVGFDANALYLWSLTQPMPTGFYNRRTAENNFKLQKSFPMEQQAREWLTWKEHVDETTVVHRHKDGAETKIGPTSIPVDGYSDHLNKVYQFHGCLFHGHQCWLTKHHPEINPVNDIPMSELRKKTEDTTTRLRGLGYDVEEIYECEWYRTKATPAVKEFVNSMHTSNKWSNSHKKGATEEEILTAVRNGEVFGIVECDIGVPETLRNIFDEMAPIFKNVPVGQDDIGDHMQQYAEELNLLTKPQKMTIGSLFGEKMMIITPLLRWYLEHGLVCTRIYQIIEYNPRPCFEKAGQRVSDARRQGDSDPDKSIIAEMEKLFGNSYYGKTVTNKEKHTKVKYYREDRNGRLLDKAISYNSFVGLTQIGSDVVEVVTTPKSIKLDLPIQVGFFVYGYAKLRMLEFYYDFMVKAFNRSDFEYCEMDTDSAYIAFSSADWKSLMKPHFRKLYDEHMANAHALDTLYKPDSHFHWFPRDCCAKHSAFDKRTPGLFKVEFSGWGIVGLCSKTYFCFGSEGEKHSSKGLQRRNQLTKDQYLDVLLSRQSGSGINRGFRVVENRVMTYEQVRAGLSYFYPKRKVRPDGVSTTALLI